MLLEQKFKCLVLSRYPHPDPLIKKVIKVKNVSTNGNVLLRLSSYASPVKASTGVKKPNQACSCHLASFQEMTLFIEKTSGPFDF